MGGPADAPRPIARECDGKLGCDWHHSDAFGVTIGGGHVRGLERRLTYRAAHGQGLHGVALASNGAAGRKKMGCTYRPAFNVSAWIRSKSGRSP